MMVCLLGAIVLSDAGELMLVVPLIMRQETMKRTSSGSLQGLGELIEFLQRIQVLFAKVEVDGGTRSRRGPCFVAAFKIESDESFRNSDKEAAPVFFAKSNPFFSASDKATGGSAPSSDPLSPIAPAMRFLERGDTICALTETEPADSPAMVILFGSPPK